MSTVGFSRSAQAGETSNVFQLKSTAAQRLGLPDSICVCNVSKMMVKSWNNLNESRQRSNSELVTIFLLGIHISVNMQLYKIQHFKQQNN